MIELHQRGDKMLVAILSLPIMYLIFRDRLKGWDLFETLHAGFYIVLVVYLLWGEDIISWLN